MGKGLEEGFLRPFPLFEDGNMKPAPFQYCAPNTVEEALKRLAEYGHDAKILAGGQSLIPTMNFRMARPIVLIDLNRISALSYIQKAPKGGVQIGAMTRHAQAETSSLIAEKIPLLAEAMPHIAHAAIRSRGTLGGSLAHNDPAAELPAVMVALEAKLRLRNKKKERWVEAENFFTGLFATVLQEGEILQEIHIPERRENTGWSFQEVSRQRGDFALVGVATMLTLDPEKKIVKNLRMAFLGVGEGPILAKESTQKIVGQHWKPELIEDVAKTAAQKDIQPPSDLHASSAYRRELAAVLVQRSLEQAFARIA